MYELKKEESKELIRLSERGYEHIVRDKNGHLYIYFKKPEKLGHEWRGISSDDINEDLFKFINWEDDEPKLIKNLLKGE